MKIEIIQLDAIKIAEIVSDNLVISSKEDGVDLLGDLYFQGFDKVILHQENIMADFFDLKTGIAGELLQKFSNYRVRLAIVGHFDYQSKSMRDFIWESNKFRQINFVKSTAAAIDQLTKPV